MYQSQLFTKTLKETPADEISINAQLLIRAGFIQKEMAGVYDYLPLGLKVLKKIENIIREEMNEIGGQEVLMTTLQNPELWKKTGRWNDQVVDNWFKTKLVGGTELGIANTHEEPITATLVNFVKSYKDLPVYIYQFQTKFRNELRTKSGIMRVREFLMKDLYSFSRTEEEFKKFYEICAESYIKIFKRTGIGDVTFRTIAAGGSFTAGLTDEFQTISKAGEDIVYIDKAKKLAINKEVYTDENIKKFGLNKSKLEEEKSIEVGNIFPLGSKYSDALGLKTKDENGVEKSVIMGCYGIGLGRLLGAIVEVHHDEKGIIWPKEVSPFDVHLVQIENSQKIRKTAEKIYQDLLKTGIEVLYDDRDKSAGEKFADADLIGIPIRIVISERTLAKNSVEIKKRQEQKLKIVKISDVRINIK
ncbi:MAG: prolyl-tRNA synthetase [Candidatus Nealsonbacteria bacterium RBG_13_42_11]|uniref:Proline--tRNA ligase n=1 Tax=Candidatus Nealsonbacteria bacterium RBG_13_42_11 TaxID=1801663 RepID=A0A1G2DYZ5_9BACT|nr:MAG: prolyl-tRNA synthetase [Candidatus Nealsonbacteria bacterium RBG_13_42_11]